MRRRSAPALTIWAAVAPSTGGVTRSAALLIDWLADRDRLRGVVDLSRRGEVLAGALRARTPPHLFWASTVPAVARHALLARLVPGPHWLFVHGGDVGSGATQRAIRLALAGSPPFERVFATNSRLADQLHDLTSMRVEVASASPLAGPSLPRVGPRRGPRHLIAVGSRVEWYGLETAVEACDLLRGDDPDARLSVLKYGGGTLPPLPRWVDVLDEVPPQDVSALLGAHDVLLRPSTVDGDALIVREALAAGLRVVASDVAPRPAGVELCRNDPAALRRALRDGGSPSDGAGLGPPISELL